MKVVLTGATGQVGDALARSRPADIELSAFSRSELDVSDKAQVDRAIGALHPDLIINAAAYTAVDRAESEEVQARAANEAGPAHLAAAAAACSARLIHLSTDYVFDGEQSRPYAPEDRTNPLNVYGCTKLAGEHAVLATLPSASIVLRTAWVYSAAGRNFVRTMLNLMAEKGSVRVVSDQFGAPTAAESIAQVVWALSRRPELHGVYHWTDAGAASWYDFAVAIAEEAAALGKLSGAITVHPIASEDYPTAAHRPRFSVLDCRKTAAALGLAPTHWRIWLRRVLGEMRFA